MKNESVETGEFPFKLTGGPTESPYLTWLRNHSNYMAVRGLLDYFRMVAVLVRGILINFLVVLPFLMVIALLLSLVYGTLLIDWREHAKAETKAAKKEEATKAESKKTKKEIKVLKERETKTIESVAEAPVHSFFLFRPAKSNGWARWMQEELELSPPYLLTPVVLTLTAAWILLFPILMALSRIAGYRKSLETGSDSSVKRRDLYERSFGTCVVVILAVVLVESLPVLVHFYHQLSGGSWFAWQGTLTTAVAALVVLSSSDKLMRVLSGVKQKVVMAIIGFLSLLAPLLFIVFVMDFLIYVPCTTEDAAGWALAPLLLLPCAYVVGISAAIVIGFFRRTFYFREYLRLLALLVGTVVFHVVLFAVILLVWFLLFLLDSAEPGYLPLILQDGDWAIYIVLVWAFEIWFFCWLLVDVNLTSIHALYRDRLASAYLMGRDAKGEVDIEQDITLGEICCYETGSTAPYHLLNVALNLQGSKDIGLRDRRSDFFIFSKQFIGGSRTGYCRSETMQLVFPQINLASAMAISAAAASPNMGRGTSPALVAFMTMLNIRLGVWVPNPGLLEEQLAGRSRKKQCHDTPPAKPGFTFDEVFQAELAEIQKRWKQMGPKGSQRQLAADKIPKPSPEHGLVGISFSGGGIRSATINLGIAQALHRAGIFDHFDYMSTVSGGGYLGSSISTLMRYGTSPTSESAGTVTIEITAAGEKIVKVTGSGGEGRTYPYAKDIVLAVKPGEQVEVGQRLVQRPGLRLQSEIAGMASVEISKDTGEQIVRVAGPAGEVREYRFTKFDELNVKTGDKIAAGCKLIQRQDSFLDRLRWQVPPRALLREMTMRLDEIYPWVNVSDGGHIENLAAIELLRRRCKFIFIGDGEADPQHFFNGLATLLRTARIDLGVHIDICLDEVRLTTDRRSKGHWAIGRIAYPGETEFGYLLYLKSSFTGIEDEVIGEYRNRKLDFPHESTADQFFDEGQFEAYRALGQCIGEKTIEALRPKGALTTMSFGEFDPCFKALWDRGKEKQQKG